MVQKWTSELLWKEALKYNTRNEFQKNSNTAYMIAYRRNLLDAICFHMKPSKTGARSEESLAAEALKYGSRGEFQKNSPSAYRIAHKRGILDKICSHMKRL